MGGSHHKCPYWAPAQGQQCLLSKGGLYIPLSEHILMFCTSNSYSSCHHYIEGCRLLKVERNIEPLSIGQGRRRFPRIQGRYPLTILQGESGDDVATTGEVSAETIDVSLGGMQVKTNRHISVGTKLIFHVNGFLLNDRRLTMSAETRWCLSGEEVNNYICGFAFEEQGPTGRLSQYLIENLL